MSPPIIWHISRNLAVAVVAMIWGLWQLKALARLREQTGAHEDEENLRAGSRVALWLVVAAIWKDALIVVQVHLGQYPGPPRGFWNTAALIGALPLIVALCRFWAAMARRLRRRAGKAPN